MFKWYIYDQIVINGYLIKCFHLLMTFYNVLVKKRIMYVIMTEELVIREIRIDKAAGRGDSDSYMTSFEVIMSLKLQSTKY